MAISPLRVTKAGCWQTLLATTTSTRKLAPCLMAMTSEHNSGAQHDMLRKASPSLEWIFGDQIRAQCKLQEELKAPNIEYMEKVKALGVALAGGRSNDDTQKERLAAFKRRVHKFPRVEAAGVSTAKIVRAGGGRSVTCGQAVLGPADCMLVTAASYPAGGPGGQNVTLP